MRINATLILLEIVIYPVRERRNSCVHPREAILSTAKTPANNTNLNP